MADWLGDPTGLKSQVFTAAISGGVVASIIRRGTLMERAVRGLSGAIASVFLTPVLAPIAEVLVEYTVKTTTGIGVDLPGESVAGGLGFVVGFAGYELARIGLERLPRILRGLSGVVEDKIEKL